MENIGLNKVNTDVPSIIILHNGGYPIPKRVSNFKVDGDTFVQKTTNPVENFTISIPLIYKYSPKQLIRAFANENYVKNAIKNSPSLQAIIKKYNLTEINPKNITDIVDHHLAMTDVYAKIIANEMNLTQSERKQLERASIFHDFGKILIPDAILNKPGRLTPEEKEIMDLHAELGYYLLLHSGLSPRELNMIRNHHKNISENNDLLGQILSVADIYSALREKRAYKKPMSVDTAFDILDQKASNGEVSAEVVNTLEASKFSVK